MLRLGFLIDFISVPVIAGFTSAAAITIASSQVLMIAMALNEVVVVMLLVVVVVVLMLINVVMVMAHGNCTNKSHNDKNFI